MVIISHSTRHLAAAVFSDLSNPKKSPSCSQLDLEISKKVIIAGGHGNVSLQLAKLLTPTHSVTSIIRNPAQKQDIRDVSATPLVLSLEEASVAEFSHAFKGNDVVYFSAGAGEEKAKKVDYIRDPEKMPAHYNEEDVTILNWARKFIPAYMHWKYKADQNLAKRTAFKWTILRTGQLSNGLGMGTADVGRTHLGKTISRADVAKALAILIDREDAANLAIDFAGGDTPIEEGLDAFIKKGETDFLG